MPLNIQDSTSVRTNEPAIYFWAQVFNIGWIERIMEQVFTVQGASIASSPATMKHTSMSYFYFRRVKVTFSIQGSKAFPSE